MKIFIPSRSLIFATTVLLVFLVPLNAQYSPQDFLVAHNLARVAVGVAPLRWDSQLASYAKLTASQRIATCTMQSSGGPFGENIARGDGSMSAAAAVRMWVKEKFDYDYNSNTCALNKVCSHYTQAVWSTTVKVGCAAVHCADNSFHTLVVCKYDPASNGEGIYVKPKNI